MLGWFAVISEQVERPECVASLIYDKSQEAPKAGTQKKNKEDPFVLT